MAFQTGTFTNSHELVDDIYGFLIGIGWTVHATLKVNEKGDGYDYVFKSTSENDDRDVYIRVGAGFTDASRVAVGDIQQPFSDGYMGFTNGLAYQYFGADESEAYNELGIFGPVLYVWSDDDQLDEINLWTSESTNLVNRDLTTSSGITSMNRGVSGFDGSRYIYGNDGNAEIRRFDLGTGTESGDFISVSQNQSSSNGILLRTLESHATWFTMTEDDDIGRTIDTWQVTEPTPQNSWTYVFPTPLYADPPDWPTPSGQSYDRTFGFFAAAMQRNRTVINGADHFRWIYAGQGYGQSTLAMFNPDSGSWTPRNNTKTGNGSPTNLPFSLGSTASGRIDRIPQGVVVPKEFSGYEYDRIYVFRGGLYDDFTSRDLDNDGYYKEGAPWILNDETPVTQSYGYRTFLYEGAIYLAAGSDDGDGVFRFDLPADRTSAGSWVQMTNLLFKQGFGSPSRQPVLAMHHHLCSRVRVSEFQTNTYWLFADRDRLVVVVKNALGRYSYMYLGLYTPYADERTGTLTTDVAAGGVSLNVTNPDIFVVGSKYMLVDNTGEFEVVTSAFAGATRNLAPSELFTVLTKSGTTLGITSLSKPYKAGSLVGADPLPLMVRVQDTERAQTLSNITLVTGREDYTDPAWQYYKIRPAVSDSFANTVDNEERSQGTFLHAMVLIDEGDAFTGKEVRGQMKDVFACGTGIANETEIAVGSKTYIAFDIDNSSQNQRIVVGPK